MRERARLLRIIEVPRRRQEPFGEATLKLQRAREHLHHLDTLTAAYFAGRPYAAFREYDDYAPERSVLSGISFTREPSPDLALVFADAIHNLRATLDYIAYELVVSDGRQPTRRTQFPIYLSRAAWDADATAIGKGNIPAAPLALIEAMQPYQDGEGGTDAPLWQLHQLSNIEKHRRMHLTSVRAAGADLMDSFGLVYFRMPNGQTQTRTFRFEHSIPSDADVEMHLKGSLFVVLEEEGDLRPAPLSTLIRQIAEFIEDRVIARLKEAAR